MCGALKEHPKVHLAGTSTRGVCFPGSEMAPQSILYWVKHTSYSILILDPGFNVKCAEYIIRCIMKSVKFAVYTVYTTVYSVQCKVYSV